APSNTNGKAPIVARPQLRAIATCGQPSVLQAAFDTNSAPRNRNSGLTQRQNKMTRSVASPVVLKIRARVGATIKRMVQAATVYRKVTFSASSIESRTRA